MLDHWYPLNIWHLGFCGEESFSVLYPGSIFGKNLLVMEDFLRIMRNFKQRLNTTQSWKSLSKNVHGDKKFVKHFSIID